MGRTGFETTPPTNGGNAAVILTIDKSGFYKGAKETGKALTAMQRKINSDIKNIGYSKTVKVSMSLEDKMMFSHILVRKLEDAVNNSTKEMAKQLSASGKAFFKNVILTAPNRVKAQPGRIDTGLMLRSVQGRTIDSKMITRVGIGWNITDSGRYYRYFSFQEDGTRNGPMPMRAVPKTAKFISEQFQQKMEKNLKLRLDTIK